MKTVDGCICISYNENSDFFFKDRFCIDFFQKLELIIFLNTNPNPKLQFKLKS